MLLFRKPWYMVLMSIWQILWPVMYIAGDTKPPSFDEQKALVTNTMDAPYQSIFHILVQDEKRAKQCSGFLGGEPTVVLTAAHCFDGIDGKVRIQVSIPEDGMYWDLTASNWEVSSKYDPHSGTNDYAAVFLPIPVEREPFILAPYPGKGGVLLHTAGFPGNKQQFPHLEMWTSPLITKEKVHGYWVARGTAVGGQSGSAVNQGLVAYGVLDGIIGKQYAYFFAFDEESLREIGGWIKKWENE